MRETEERRRLVQQHMANLKRQRALEAEKAGMAREETLALALARAEKRCVHARFCLCARHPVCVFRVFGCGCQSVGSCFVRVARAVLPVVAMLLVDAGYRADKFTGRNTRLRACFAFFTPDRVESCRPASENSSASTGQVEKIFQLRRSLTKGLLADERIHFSPSCLDMTRAKD